MNERRKLPKVQRFCVLQKLCDWLDAQVRAGIDDNSIARAAVSEFLYEIKEQERTGRRQAEVREAALTYRAKCGWALEPQETISNNGENPLPRHVKWAQMVCALGLGEPGTVGFRQAQKRLSELLCCFIQVDGTSALILLEKDSAKSCG